LAAFSRLAAQAAMNFSSIWFLLSVWNGK